MELRRGQKVSIQTLYGGKTLDLVCYHKAPAEIDVTCFGLDAAGRLSDEQYFIFYNHKQSPGGGISLIPGGAAHTTRFHLELDKLPPHIAKLSFTAAIDGPLTMRDLDKGYVQFLTPDTGLETARYSYGGCEFHGERALVICEVYRKGGQGGDWRINAVGRGFNGGLKALVESFGGSVLPEPQPQPQPRPQSRSGPASPPGANPVGHIVNSLPPHICARLDNLARQCRGDTEYLLPLCRSMFEKLAQYPRTVQKPVRIVLCADVSGSMFDMYRNGRVQRVVDKFFTFAAALSDAPQMDFWAFGAKSRQLESVTLDNVRDYTFAVSGGFERWMSMLNYQYNNEPEAMRDIMMIYGARQTPTMVLFLTDGRLSSDWEIEEILIKTSRFPIFWQFVGLHGEEYGILNHLDAIDGRYTQNAAFFQTADIDDLSDAALYSRLLASLDAWLDELAFKRMLYNDEGGGRE